MLRKEMWEHVRSLLGIFLGEASYAQKEMGSWFWNNYDPSVELKFNK